MSLGINIGSAIPNFFKFPNLPKFSKTFNRLNSLIYTYIYLHLWTKIYIFVYSNPN